MDLKWNTEKAAAPQGVLTGCEESQEWMLKWWFENYSKHNTLPVTFADFGMSASARSWCEKRGNVISIPPQELQNAKNAPWADKVPGYIWNHRTIWFCKPLAFLKTPYETTIWTDIDCEIIKNITPMFSLAEVPDGFAIRYDKQEYEKYYKEHSILKHEARCYQAGVIVFKRYSKVINNWAKYCFTQNNQEYSEQSALSHLLSEKPLDITHFSDNYHWFQSDTKNPSAYIIHHSGAFSKRRLLSSINLK
ncbi:MAG: hypothetical protein KDK69_02380 [Chlamydiia bacterium]|nr:hypothetical protein [Chlamydiia bacterium]